MEDEKEEKEGVELGVGGEIVGVGDRGGDVHVYSAAGASSWKQGTGRPPGRGFLMDVSFQRAAAFKMRRSSHTQSFTHHGLSHSTQPAAGGSRSPSARWVRHLLHLLTLDFVF